MFGNQQNKPFTFGGSTFGQPSTGFGQPQTSVFGQTSTFGSPATTQQSGGLFGSTQPAGGLFGQTTQSAFGQAPQQQQQAPNTSFSFGGTPQQTPQPSLFGQQTAQQTATPNAFTGGAFGAQANRSAFGGFGTSGTTGTAPTTTGGLFGQQSTPAPGGLFGGVASSTTGAGVFGGSSGPFGAVGVGVSPVGTTIPFKAVTGTDTMMKNGSTTNIQTQHQCISCMKEYENKSLEELRVEDYMANRKHGMQNAGAFGTPAPNAPGTGLFGSTGGGFSFGNPSTQSKPLFGGTTSGFGTSTTQPATTAFGQTNPAVQTPFGAPASSAPSIFGQNTTTTGFGAFGTQQKPAFGGFGTTPAASATPAGGAAFGGAKPFGATPAFGATTATPFGAPATGVGGQAKPAGLGFGPTQTGFGLPQGTSTFGAPAASSSAFSFGTTTTTPSTSLFGGKPTTSTGPFGATSTPFSFGSSTGTPFVSQQVTSAPKPFGVFGNQPQSTFGTPQAGLGTSGSVFGQAPPQMPAGQSPLLESLRAQQLVLMTSLPLAGSDSFFKVEQKKDTLRPTSLAAQKAVIEDLTVKPRTMPIAKIKVTPVNLGTSNLNNSSLFAGLEDRDISSLNMQSPKRFTIKPKSPPSNVLSLSFFDMPLNRPVMQPKESDGVGATGSGSSNETLPLPSAVDTATNASSPCTPLRGTPGQDSSGKAKGSASETIHEEETLNLRNDEEQSILAGEANKENTNRVGITLRRPGYYTKPPLSTLKLDSNGQCWVNDFTVGRTGYGSVMFPGRIDVAGLDIDSTVVFRRKEITVYPDESMKPPLGQGLNRRAEVSLDDVYPIRKSATDKELVTNPDTLLMMSWRQRLERYTIKMGAVFLDFDEFSGRWSFRVDHFSRYGLVDSDDSEVEMTETRPLPSLPPLQQQQQQQQQHHQSGASMSKAPVGTPSEEEMGDIEQPKLREENMNLTRIMEVTSQDNVGQTSNFVFSPASFQMCHSMQLKPAELQGMKASLFMMDDDDDDEEEPSEDGMGDNDIDQWIRYKREHRQQQQEAQEQQHHQIYPIKTNPSSRLVTAALKAVAAGPDADDKLGQSSTKLPECAASAIAAHGDRIHQPVGLPALAKKVAFDVYNEFISKFNKFPTIRNEPTPLERCKVVHAAARFEIQRVPSEASIFSTIAADVHRNELAAFNRLRMRPSLQQWTLVRVSEKTLASRPLNITMLGHASGASAVSFDKVNFPASADPLTELMATELNNSSVTFDSNGLPLYAPKIGVTLLQDHILRLADQEDLFEAELLNTLKLCDALWGDGVPDSSDPVQMECARKRALSVWIAEVMEGVVAQEVALAENPLQAIISLLSGHQISAACDEAVAQGDYNLATLIAQAGHDQTTKQIAKRMCFEWTESKKDQMIDTDRLRIYALLAGYPRWTLSDGGEVNVCAGLDWLRCFALHLWYLCPSNLSVAEVLAEYEQAAQQYATNPEVHYGQADSGDQERRQDPLHVCFQLIRLFTDSSQTVEKILCPDTVLSVQSQLEYRHCWLLGLVLESLEYQVPCAEELHVRMACQLEAMGLWQWGVFALLHIRNPQRRYKCVYDLICRHATATVDLSEEDRFVANTMKVPTTLIYRAKALRASFEGRRVNQAKLLILADELNEAHEVLSNHIAVKAIINEQYQLLGDLLQKLCPASLKIGTWSQRGRVYLHYIQLTSLLKEVLAAKDDETAIEAILSRSDQTLESILASLSAKISRLPKETVEQRLCQIEMAKTTFTAYKTVLTVKSMSDPHLKNSAVRAVIQLLRKLPLPEDTVAHEFRRLSEEYPEYLPNE
ncbi:nuclear pore complex protein Nup98-Nup96-like, partial [Tropilaelaps mercedesae]